MDCSIHFLEGYLCLVGMISNADTAFYVEEGTGAALGSSLEVICMFSSIGWVTA